MKCKQKTKITSRAKNKSQCKMNKIILTIIVGMFLISLVGATQQTLGTFKQGSCMQLVQTCGNCTYNNVSFVYQTNNAILYNISEEMAKVGTFYNHTFCNTSLVGEYVVNGVGNPNGKITSWVYDFKVTPSGSIDIGSGGGLSFIGSTLVMLIIAITFFITAFNVKNIAAKVSFFSFSAINFIMVILFVVVSAQQNLYGYTGLVSGVETFWTVIQILVSLGLLTLFIIIGLIIKKAFKIKRGYE